MSPLVAIVASGSLPGRSIVDPPFSWIMGPWFLVAGVAAFVFRVLPGSLRMIRHPFCIHCGYDLAGLPDHQECPECGILFSFADIEAYKKNPEKFRREWRRRQKNRSATSAGG